MEFDSDESRKGRFQRPRRADRSAAAHGDVPISEGEFGPDAVRLLAGNAGDHRLVYALLRAANQAPSYEEFLTWLDEPTYEPTDRLLVKRNDQIVAHVQVLDRVAWFEGVKLRVGGVQGLATLPEFHDAGYEHRLLVAAERSMRDRQAVVAFARTDRPEAFRNLGWSDALGQRFTEANVNDILAHLSTPATTWTRRKSRPLRIRLWRHVELDGLRAVYHHAGAAAWGALDRSEPYWRWLVSRKAHDQLIVAIHGKDDWEELDSPAHIVGYAVTRGAQVTELCTLFGFAHAARTLLARACQDAIEQDHRSLSLQVPANDPLHELMLSASGSWSTNVRAGCGTLMVKLLDPARWIELMYAVLLERAKRSGVSRPCSIVFGAGRRKYCLELTRRSGHLSRDDAAKVDVRCAPHVLGTLLVGNLDVAAARQAGQLEIRDDATAERLATLFPMAAFWQSQFDTRRF